MPAGVKGPIEERRPMRGVAIAATPGFVVALAENGDGQGGVEDAARVSVACENRLHLRDFLLLRGDDPAAERDDLGIADRGLLAH